MTVLGTVDSMRRLWLRFLGGLFVFGVIMFFVVMGVIETKEFLEGNFFPEGIPGILTFGLAFISCFIMVAVLGWTTGESYKQLDDIRIQKKKKRRDKDSSSQ